MTDVPPDTKKKPPEWLAAFVLCGLLVTGIVYFNVEAPSAPPQPDPETTAPAIPPLVIDPTKPRWEQVEAQSRLYLKPCAALPTADREQCKKDQRGFMIAYMWALKGDTWMPLTVAGYFMPWRLGMDLKSPGEPANQIESCAWLKFATRDNTAPAIRNSAEAECMSLSVPDRSEALSHVAAITKAVSPANRPPRGWHPTLP